MRAVLLLFFSLLIAAPASLVDRSLSAEAAGAKSRKSKGRPKKKVRRPPKKPQIKLREAPATDAPEPAASSAPPQRGPTRIDFDDRLVQGQTNKSGSVYLYDRKELKSRSMVKKRESFRGEIVEAVYDSE